MRLPLPFYLLLISPCIADVSADSANNNGGTALEVENAKTHLTTDNDFRDLVTHPAFSGSGELLMPRDDNSSDYGTPISEVASLMNYHRNVRPHEVLNAVNHMIDEVSKGRKVIYDFYTEQQKQQDPAKRNTGLFFFRGKLNAPFAVVCPGGGFSYVGSLHEGFPLALRVSQSGFNAFVIRYRLGSEQHATKDLAAAISFIFRNADELGVSTHDYALWGGSAGARMVGNIAIAGMPAYGEGDLPKPASVIMAYTGQRSWSPNCPPVFATVAANDGIVDARAVDTRVENLRKAGVEVEYHRFQSAGHGFGLGTGTDAEGWLDSGVDFWSRHIRKN
ncbi:MAG: alpha/beta hydrolase [Verrucomicrobiota bacterium]|nr:alpha/beta hydrolase [Verrucomicrobiota bacterium]